VRIENAHKLSRITLSQRADDLPTVLSRAMTGARYDELSITDYRDYTDVSAGSREKC